MKRHARPEELKALREIADRIGPAELLRIAAGIAAHDCPDLHKGDEIRSAVNRAALAYQAAETAGKP